MRVLLGVSGSIAAYKAAELARLLVKEGYELTPVLTKGAERFVSQELFDALARRGERGPYPHLERHDALVVAPASANVLARLAAGLADDLLTEAALAHQGPLLVAPAMNPRMWAHPATEANVRLLRERGVIVVGPGEGETAEGEEGLGRMAEPAEVAAALRAALAPGLSALAGVRVLVTAGGTREPLDLVRFLGNRSSGRMGLALAAAAARRGAAVELVAANVDAALLATLPRAVDVVQVETAAELEAACLAGDFDVLLMSAAVSDYRAKEPLTGKRPKGEPWTVELEPSVDVLKELARRRRPEQILVGFGAEGPEGKERKRRMLEEKGLDLVVYNDVSAPEAGFGQEALVATLFGHGRSEELGRVSKQDLAERLLDAVTVLLEELSLR